MGRAAAGARIAGRWLFAAALLAMATPMHAAEIKVLSSNATKTLLEDIAPMFERFGIAAEMKAKYVLGDGSSTGPIVARGDAEMAIQQISALKPHSGVEIVGPLPDELQLVTILSAGIGAAGQSRAAVQKMIRYFGTPEAIAVIKAKGLEPGKN